jgi:phytoene synthase
MPDAARGDGAEHAEFLRRAVPPGSPRHLALLFSGAAARSLPEAVYAFEAELRRIVTLASHEASHARLLWWRDEIDRLAAGRPTHPIARTLLPLREHAGADVGLLRDMLVAAGHDLARTTCLTWQELGAYLFRSGGTVQTLIAAALAADGSLSREERDFARRLGASVRQAEMLLDLDNDLARGRLYAPLQALETAGIDPQAFAARRADAAARAFVEGWCGRVQRELLELPAVLATPDQRNRQRHGVVLAALHAEALEYRKTGAGDAGARAGLQPLRRLWTAWRAAVRSA